MHSITKDYFKQAEEIKKFVKPVFSDFQGKGFIYHNFKHTEDVVEAVLKMAEYYKLSEQDIFILTAAAWFHDIGYFTVADQHEQTGADIAGNYLQDKGLDEEIISQVKKCILSTRVPQKPGSLLEQIICDADLFHLGTSEFPGLNKQMRKETETLSGIKTDKSEWRAKSIRLLEGHHFFTDYGAEFLQKKQNENLEILREKQGQEGNSNDNILKVIGVKNFMNEKKQGEKLEEMKAKDAPASRGIQTMFRIISSNNQRLSVMADNKAHIMITVNSIILSIILGVLLRKLDPANSLIYPSILFIGISLTAIVFAILATRPSIPKGIFTAQEFTDKKANLLFFGNFYKMSLDDYSADMHRLMEDRNFLYGSLINDIHAQGVVLGKKYHMLRITYNIFMYGLIASVIAYVIAILFFTSVPLKASLLQTTMKKQPAYDLTKPERVDLPDALKEASGIAFYKGNADTIYTEEDETAKLFHFHLGDRKEFITKFGKHGDYEDLTICREYVTLLRSDGVFFTFPFSDSRKEVTTAVKEVDGLLPGGEYESLGSVESTGQLFVLCKHSKKENNTHRSEGYIFKLTADGDIIADGKFDVDMIEIGAKLGNKTIDFRPSGLALNPRTNEWYIISTVNKLLVVTSRDWKVNDVYPLDPSIFRQPEGIAFDNASNLYISNEKNTSSSASIMKFMSE